MEGQQPLLSICLRWAQDHHFQGAFPGQSLRVDGAAANVHSGRCRARGARLTADSSRRLGQGDGRRCGSLVKARRAPLVRAGCSPLVRAGCSPLVRAVTAAVIAAVVARKVVNTAILADHGRMPEKVVRSHGGRERTDLGAKVAVVTLERVEPTQCRGNEGRTADKRACGTVRLLLRPREARRAA